MPQDITDAMAVLLRNSPQLNSMEHATVAMTVASIVIAAVALGIAVFAARGIVTSIFSARRIAAREVDRAVDRRIDDMRADLPSIVDEAVNAYMLGRRHQPASLGDDRDPRQSGVTGEREAEY